MTNPDTDTGADTVDWPRSAPLDDQGLPGYTAVVSVGPDGGEPLLALARRDLLGGPADCWPADWRAVAPHELPGRLPRAFAPSCGRTASTSGRPCRARVPSWGDACAHHAGADAPGGRP